MTNDKIRRELESLKSITDTWDGPVSEMEKDIALEKLRRLYELVKFGAAGKAAAVEAEPIGAQPSREPETCAAGDKETEQATEKVEKTPAPEPEKEPDVQTVQQQEAATVPAEETVTDNGGEPHTGKETPAKPKLSRDVIRSLYGDDITDPHGHTYSYGMGHKPEAPDRHHGGHYHGGGDQDTPHVMPESALSGTMSDNLAHAASIGDTIGNGEQTISDIYAKNTTATDVATKIGNGKVTDMRHAIGINDKFLIIRDLFGGDSDIYEATISELDSFEDLDEALLHIHDAYKWNPNNEGVKIIIDLLTRKLS